MGIKIAAPAVRHGEVTARVPGLPGLAGTVAHRFRVRASARRAAWSPRWRSHDDTDIVACSAAALRSSA